MLTQSEIAALSTATERANDYIARLRAQIETQAGPFTWVFPTPGNIAIQSQLHKAVFDFNNTVDIRDAAIEGGDHELALKAIEQFNMIANGQEVPYKTPLRDAIDGIKESVPTAEEIKESLRGLVPEFPKPDLTWLKVTVVVIGLVALAYISRLFPRRAA